MKDLKKQLSDLFSSSDQPQPSQEGVPPAGEPGEPQKKTRQAKAARPRAKSKSAEPLDAAPPAAAAQQMAQASEAHLQALVDDLPVGYHEIDIRGRIRRVNRTELAMLGYTAEEMLGRSAWEFVADQEASRRAIRDKLTQKMPLQTLERTLVRKDGGLVPVMIQERYLLAEPSGETPRVVGIRTTLQDITEHKRTEQALRRQNAELDALHQTTLGLLDQLDPQVLIETILTRAAELAGTAHGYLYVLEPDGQSMTVKVGIGAFADWVGYRLQRGQGVAGRVWDTNAPLTVEDYQTWSGKQPGFEWLHAVVGIPLRSASKVIGVISLGHLEKGRVFDQDATGLLGRFAELASLTLQNAQVYGTAQQELEERKQAETERERRITELATLNDIARELSSALSLDELYQAVYRQVGRVLDATNFFIAAYEEGAGGAPSDEWTMAFQIEHGEPGQVEKYKLGPGLTSYVLRSRKPLMLCNLEENKSFFEQQKLQRVGKQCRSWMGVPLIAARQLVGAMVIQNYEQDNLYGDQDLALFTTIASQAAIAIQNARLLEQARARAVEMAVLNEISQELTAQLDVAGVLERVYQGAARLLAERATNFFVGLYDPASDQITFPFYVTNGQHRETGTVIRGGQGKTGYVIHTRQPLLIKENVAQWRAEHNVEALDPQDALSWLGAPIIVGERVLGVLAVENYTTQQIFDEHDQELLVSIANQTAIAIQNARLFEEAQHRAQELATANEIMQAVSQQVELPRVLQAIYEQIRHLVQVDAFAVGLYDEQTNLLSYPLVIDEGRRYAESPRPLSPTTFIGKTIHSGQPILFNRTAQELAAASAQSFAGLGNTSKSFASLINVPLKLGERTIGALSVQSYRLNAYTQAHVEQISNLTSQVVVAIQNARLFESVQRRVTELSMLNDISGELASALRPEELYRLVHQQMSRLFDTTSFFIGTFEAGSDHWQMAYRIENGQPAELGRRDLKAGLGSYMIRTRQPLLIHSAQELADFFQSQNVQQVGLRGSQSWMGVPLIAAGQIVGVMAIQSYTQENLYSDQDLALFSTVAVQVATALQNARLFESVQRRVTELSMFNDISRELASALRPEELYGLVHQQMGRLFDTTSFFIGTFETGSDHWQMAYRIENGQPAELGRRDLKVGLSSYMIKTRQPLLFHSAQELADFYQSQNVQQLDLPGTRSWMGVPLIAAGQVVGVMVIQSYTHENLYGEHDLALFSTVAVQVATALQNARLFEQAQRRAQEMATANEIALAVSQRLDLTDVLETTYQHIRQLMPLGAFMVGLYDEQTNQIAFPLVYDEGQRYQEASRPLSPGMYFSTAIHSGQSILLNRTPEELAAWVETPRVALGNTRRAPASAIYVPLKAGDKIIGAFSVQSYQYNAYAQEHVDLLARLTNQMVVAIENARLFTESQQRINELAIINDIGQELSSALNVQELVEVVYRQTGRIFDVNNFFIATYEPGSSEWFSAVHTEQGERQPTVARKLGAGLTSHILLNRQPLVFHKTEEIDAFHGTHPITRVGPEAKSWMGVPLVAGGDAVGVMAIQSYTQENLYGEHDLALFSTIAAQAAIALQNARLFEQSRQRINELAILNDIGRQVSAALTLEELYQTVYREVGRVFDTTNFFIADYQGGSQEWTMAFRSEQGQMQPTGRRALGPGLTSHIIRNRQPLVLNNTSKYEAFLLEHQIERVGPTSKSWMGIPLIAAGQVVGVMAIQSYEQENAYSDQDLALFNTIGAQAAVAFQNTRLFEQTRQRVAELETLNQVSQVIASQLDLNALLQRIGEITCQIFDEQTGYIALYDPQLRQVSFPFFVYQGKPRQVEPAPLGAGLTSAVIANRKPVRFNQLTPQILQEMGGMMTADDDLPMSWLGVPILAGEEVIGVLNVQALLANRFSEADERLLNTIASSVGVAIQNARLFEQTRQRVTELETLSQVSQVIASQLDLNTLIQRIVEIMCQLFDVSTSFICLYDSHQRQLTFPFYLETGNRIQVEPAPLGSGLTSIVITSRKPLLITQGTTESMGAMGAVKVAPGPTKQSWLGVPILVGEDIIGVLNVQALPANHFSEASERLLNTVASSVGIAIQNARLFEQAQTRAREMATLNELSRAFSTRLDVNQVMQEVYRGVSRLMDTTNFFIALYDPQIDEVHFPFYAEGDFIRPLQNRRRGGHGMTEYVIRTRAPLLIEENVQARQEELGIEGIGTKSQSWLGVPMIVGDQVIGVVAVQSYTTPRVYNEYHRDLLSGIAAQAAVSLQNARLFQESQQRITELSILNDIGREFSSSLDLDALFRVVHQQVSRVFDATNFYIATYEEGSAEWTMAFHIVSGESRPPRLRQLATGRTSHIIRTRQPLVLNTTQDNHAFFLAQGAERPNDPTKSWMGVPLIAARRIVGVMAIQNHEQENLYRAQDQVLFSTIAAQAAIAIQNARLFQEVQSRAQELATVNEIGQAVTRQIELSQVLETAYQQVRRLVPLDAFIIGLYDRRAGLVSYPLIYDEGQRYERSAEPFNPASRVGQVLSGSAPLLLHRTPEETQAAVGQTGSMGNEARRSASLLYVPLKLGDQVIGVLSVQSYQLNAYTQENVELLTRMTNQLVIAVQNARLYDQVRARAEEMTALNNLSRALSSRLNVSQVMEEVHRGVTRLLNTTNFYVGLYNPDRHEITFPYNVTDSVADQEITTLSADQGLSGYIIRTRESVLIRDNVNAWLEQHGMTRVGEPAQSWLGAPMLLGDQALGVLAVQNYETPNFYDEHDREVLMAIASQAAIAIQNARLFEETRTRAEELAALNNLSQKLTTRLDVAGVLEEVYRGASRLMDTTNFTIALYDENKDEISFPLDISDGQRTDDGLVVPSSQGMTGYVIRHREPVLIRDGAAQWRAEKGIQALGSRLGAQSWLTVPMLVGDRVLGVLTVQNYTVPRAFDEHDQELLTSLASQAAIALQNARLFEEARTRAEELAVLNDLSQRLTARMDVAGVLEEAYRGAARLMDTTNFAISLYDERKDEIHFILDRTDGQPANEGRVLSSSQGMTGYVVRHREPVLIKDGIAQWRAERGIEAIGARLGAQSWLGVPMLLGDRVLGVLTAQSYTNTFAFDEHDRELLTSIASQTAIAIQNAHLFQETQQRNAELSTLNEIISSASQTLDLRAMLDAVLRQTMQIAGFDGGLITLHNETRNKLERIVRLGLPGQIPDDPAEGLENSLCAVVFESKSLVVIEDFRQGAPVDVSGEIAAGNLSYIGLPIEARGKAVGTLCGFRKTAGPFGENAAVLLQTVGRQIGFAVENARLFGETQTSLAEATALYQASRRIEAARDLQDMVAAIAESFDAPGFQRATLFILEQGENGRADWQSVVVQGNWHKSAGREAGGAELAPVPIGTRLSKEMFATLGLIPSPTPIFIDDTQSDERIEPAMAAVLRQRNIRALALLPLGMGAQRSQTGLLMLASQSPHHFTEREMQAYATLVGQLAVVMENRRLLQEAESRARREQVLREITSRVRGSIDPDAIVRTAVRELGTALGRPAFVRLGSQEQLAQSQGNGGQPAPGDVPQEGGE